KRLALAPELIGALPPAGPSRGPSAFAEQLQHPVDGLWIDLFTGHGHGSVWPKAADRHSRGSGLPRSPAPAHFARASTSRSRDRCEGVRSLRSARGWPFRSREDRHCHRHKDPCPRRGVARSWPRPDDRSTVPPWVWGPVYDGPGWGDEARLTVTSFDVEQAPSARGPFGLFLGDMA